MGIRRSSYFPRITPVSARDTSALLDLVHEGAADTGTEPFPSRVLDRLVELIPSDACVGYQDGVVDGRRFEMVEQVRILGEPPRESMREAFEALAGENPIDCRIRMNETRVLRLSDFLTRAQRRRLAWEAEVWRPYGIDDALRLWFPAPHGRVRSLYLERSGKKYTDRERTLLSLLRPHLVRMRANAAARRSSSVEGRLTPREAEVLHWIAVGKTNAQIARVLFISPNTVRKHIENIFDKLGVHTRGAAVAHLRPDSSRPPPLRGRIVADPPHSQDFSP